MVQFDPVEPVPMPISRTGRGFIDLFYGAAQHSPYDLRSRLSTYRPRMPEHFLPIADSGGGDQIAIMVGGDKSGSVFFWDHHAEWDEEDYLEDGLPEPPDLKWQNVTLIAPSFEDLLKRLSIRSAIA
jgi:hypothetical protein